MTEPGRPFKVWNCDRSVRKSVTASSLQELVEKGSCKLNLDSLSTLKIVLEEDGTEVDDDDYLALLPDNSTFLFLQNNEQWMPAGKESTVKDEPDNSSGSTYLIDDVTVLAKRLRLDISNILTFSSEQLQELVDCKTPVLAHLMGQSERYALSVQTACQRHLDEHAQTKEAVDLLKLYHQVLQTKPSNDEQTGKKRKTEDSL